MKTSKMKFVMLKDEFQSFTSSYIITGLLSE